MSGVRPARGEEIELRVDALAYGGEGVARVGEEGYVVFVAGAVPGDRVRAVVYKRKRAYAHARTVEILEPSAERVPPRAAHPGVPWQVLPYERQLAVKSQQVDDALRRIGRLDGFALEPIVPASERWRYRNKLEYSFGHADGADPATLVCGFHAPARWNRVEHIEDCLLASEQANRAREVTYRWCREQGLRAWERAAVAPRSVSGPRAGSGRPAGPSAGAGAKAPPRARSARAAAREQRRLAAEERTGPDADGRALLRNLVVREGRRTGRLQVRLVTTDGRLDVGSLALALREALGEELLSGVLWTRSRQLGETTAGGLTELVWGEECLPERICGLELAIPAEAFFQTNTEMAEVLYGLARDQADLAGGGLVYDLYCGLGTIGLALAASHAGRASGEALRIWGVELSPEAVEAARDIAARNGLGDAHFVAGEVRRKVAELTAGTGPPDVVVLDPPRAGLGRKAVESVVACSPRRIVYVSCNPTTLAADAAQLTAAGWALGTVRPVDMFPQTHHIECVAVLERSG